MNSDLFSDVEALKEQVTALSTSYLTTTNEHRIDINQNRLDISQNRFDISQNTFDISQNTFDISKNKFDTSQNTFDISIVWTCFLAIFQSLLGLTLPGGGNPYSMYASLVSPFSSGLDLQSISGPSPVHL